MAHNNYHAQMVYARCLLPLFLIAIATPLAHAQPDGNKLVTPTLITDATTIEPGKPFRVGVVLQIEPGYHIYWKNPGESGQPTDVKWNLPQGFAASEIEWPAPKKFMVPGAIFNFGYDERVILLATITPSSGTVNSPIISAECSWLVCNDDSCIPGKRSVTLTVPDAAAAQVNAKSLDEAHAAVPVPADKSADVGRVIVAAEEQGKQLKVEWKTAVSRIEFFPNSEDVKIQSASISTNKLSTPPVSIVEVTAVPAVAGQSVPESIEGVLSFVTADGQRRGIEVTIPNNKTSP